MNEANPTWLVSRVGIVGETRQRGRDCREHADSHCRIGRALRVDQIQQGASEPGADGHVRERRVHRVAEPDTIQPVLDPPTRGPTLVDRGVHQ